MEGELIQIERNHGTAGRLGWLMTALPIVGIVVLAFLFGMVTSIRQAAPFYTVRDAWLAWCSLREQQDILSNPWPEYLWYPAEREPQGLVQSRPDQTYGDYTSYTSADGLATLVDGEGRIVHQWDAPFRRVFPHALHVPSWIPDHFIFMRRGLVYPNGDLLALYETIANTPSGCGLAKLDVNGRVLWTYDEYTHHDVTVGPDGRIYVLVHQLRRLTDSDTELKPLSDLPLVEDFVAILSPEGQELKRISLLDALVNSPYFRTMFIHVDRYGDITHNNTVDVIGEEFASHYPEVSAGDLMVCLRNLNLVLVVSPGTGQAVWGTTGPWEHPHDPDPLPNGNILIFNNLDVRGTEQGSSVLEFDPRTRQVDWLYTGDGRRSMRSDIRGSQELLPNGNVLITEPDHGRIVEVNRAGETVWEYVTPVRGGTGQELVPAVCGSFRFTREQLPFVEQLPATPARPALSGKVAAVEH